MILILLLIMALLGFASAAPAPRPVSAPAAPAPADVTPETVPAGAAIADEPVADLTIRNWVCPVTYPGANYAQACADPVADMEFIVSIATGQADISEAGLTDGNGAVTFTDLPAGIYDVNGGPPGEFVQNAISCHVTDLERLALPIFPRDNRTISLALVDTDITCDWYSIPEDLRGDA